MIFYGEKERYLVDYKLSSLAPLNYDNVIVLSPFSLTSVRVELEGDTLKESMKDDSL